MMKKWSGWWLFTLIWFAVSFAAFWFSEYYRDIDAVVYPCVLILIFSLLLGPGTCAYIMPPPKSRDASLFWAFRGCIVYAAWWGLVAVLARLCFRTGLLPH